MKKLILSFSCLLLFVLFCFIGISPYKEKEAINTMKGSILAQNKKETTIQDENNIIYTLSEQIDANVGDLIVVKYTGILDDDKKINKKNIVKYEITPVIQENNIQKVFQDNGIFSSFYTLAEEKLETMSLDEKIHQILLVRYPEDGLSVLKEHPFGGYVFFEKDFQNKTKEQVQGMISSLQASVKIPILTAVDEEGGTVTRISSNKNLRKEKFKSPSELYKEGGFSNIEFDTIEKSALLNELGLNVNLAPVVDVATEKDNYIYERALGEDTEKTSEYAKTVIKASKNMKVSYVLKHFPGYANNEDSHENIVEDERDLDTIKKTDLPPFEAGIKEGAEAILVNHNIMKSIDDENPASLSSSVHNILRDDLGFTGIIITDDLDMKALDNIENKTIKAILAGNDLIITTDYMESRNEIKNAIEQNTLSEVALDKMVFRILAWKYYKGLLFEVSK